MATLCCTMSRFPANRASPSARIPPISRRRPNPSLRPRLIRPTLHRLRVPTNRSRTSTRRPRNIELEPEAGDDVLETTPEFLQDAPEHDRLWFEQRPPRDFDFDG